jgi:hypothetical protein
MRSGTPRGQGRDGTAMTALIGSALVACLTACLVACTPSGAGESRPSPTASSPAPTPSTQSDTPAPTPSAQVPVAPAQLPGTPAVVEPTRLRVDAIAVDMPVTGVGVEPNGQMQLPTDPAIAGWYRFGPDAAATAGHIVIAAHVDAVDYPIGPLARLREVTPGTSVTIGAPDGSARAFVVESLKYYEKASLPTSDLFARDGAPALVIITCGGPFDSTTGHYRDNVVAIARPQ